MTPPTAAPDELAPSPQPLGLVFHQYELERVVASSGDRGVVFLARELPRTAVERKVALTVLDADRLRPQVRDAFEGRWSVASTLNHPTLVAIRSWGDHAGLPYVATEWLQGRSLAAVLERLSATGERMDTRMLASIGIQLAEALCYVHEAVDAHGVPLGLVHGSVAPSRVLLTDTGYVKLLGFALPSEARTSQALSSPSLDVVACVAPELFERATPTIQSDIYSLAMVLEALAAGRLRYHGDTPLDVREAIADGAPAATGELDLVLPLAAGLGQWTQRDVSRRPASCRVLSQTFGRILSQEGGPLQPAEWREVLEELFADEPPAGDPGQEFAGVCGRVLGAIRACGEDLFIPETTGEVGVDGARHLDLLDTSEEPIPGLSLQPAAARQAVPSASVPPAPWRDASGVGNTFASSPSEPATGDRWLGVGAIVVGVALVGMAAYGLFLGARVADALGGGLHEQATVVQTADQALMAVLDDAERLLQDGHPGDAAARLEDAADLHAADVSLGLRAKRLKRLSQRGVWLSLAHRASEAGEAARALEYTSKILAMDPSDQQANALHDALVRASAASPSD